MARQPMMRCVHVEGVVMTMLDGHTSLAPQVVHDVRTFLSENLSSGVVYQSVIPRSLRLAETPSYGKTILEYDPHGRGTEAYRVLAEELLRRHQLEARSPPPE